jgi:hypothetical protein
MGRSAILHAPISSPAKICVLVVAVGFSIIFHLKVRFPGCEAVKSGLADEKV